MAASLNVPWLSALCSILLAGLVKQGAAQAGREEMLVERAIARYAADYFHGRPLALEAAAQEFATPHPPTGPPLATYRTREHLAALARDAGATLLTGRLPALCSLAASSPPPGCVRAIIRIGVPIIQGDSATIWLYTYEVLSETESAEVDLHLLLVRRAEAWAFVKELEMREALAIKPADKLD